MSKEILPCPKCGGDVEVPSDSCPHCGEDFSSLIADAKVNAIGGFVGLVFVVLVTVWWIGESDDSNESDESDSPREIDWTFHAIIQCESEVKRQLKAPSTAKFVKREQEVYKMGESKWGVVGAVDAQNSFGAIVRSEFACQLSRGESGQWTFQKVLIE